MNVNKIKIISSKNDYVIKDGVLFAKPAGATPMVGKDNRMYLSYDLGFKLVIPTGMIALILAPNDASKYSVAQCGNFMLLPGTHETVNIEYKINTDAIPRVFEKDEVCAQILFISTASVEFENIIEESNDVAKEEAVAVKEMPVSVDEDPLAEAESNDTQEAA